MLGGLALLWAGSFFFYKVLVAELPPFTIVFARVAIAAAVLRLVLMLRGDRRRAGRGLWASFATMGLLNNVLPFSLIVFAETQVSSGVGSILNATTPMFTVLVAQGFTRDEKLDRGKAVGLALGLIGVAALVGPSALSHLGRGDVPAQLAVVAAALSYGCAGVFGRRFRGMSPLAVAAGQLTSSAVLTAPLVVLVDRPWNLPGPDAGGWTALIGLAVFSTALAYRLFFRILAGACATAVSLVTLLVPVGAVLLGWAVLDERLTASAFVGLSLIGAGLAFIDGRPVAWMRGRLT